WPGDPARPPRPPHPGPVAARGRYCVARRRRPGPARHGARPAGGRRAARGRCGRVDRPGPMTAPAPVVLVPRGGEWGEQVADRLTAQGMRPWLVPIIRTEILGGDALDPARPDR